MALSITGCYYDNEEELYPSGGVSTCDTTNVSYLSTVEPVLSTNCYICHGNGAQQGNVSFDSYEKLKVYVDNGRFFGAISHASGFSPMPKGGNKLPDCTLSKIQSWINAGAPNN